MKENGSVKKKKRKDSIKNEKKKSIRVNCTAIIEQLFADKKKKNKVADEQGQYPEKKPNSDLISKKKKYLEQSGIFGKDVFTEPRGQPSKRRKTSDGLKIYTEEELNIGKGGDTSDCPIDCNCCF